MEAVFRGRDVLALMPTGSGKSLCYQLPSLFLPRTVLVVSPLIALMQDQQEKAEEAEIAVEKLDSTLSASELNTVTQSIISGSPRLLYVTPERLENEGFLSTLASAGVSLLAVDEAHCISQWGHDFRPAYLSLHYARERLGNPPVLALTATASDRVVHDILSELNARNAVVVNTGTERNNLELSVLPTVNATAKQMRLMDLICRENGSGIIYTASIRSVEDVYEWLSARGVPAGRYHGRLPARERERVQAEFMAGNCRVLVATKAFGLGVDKPDVRFVYHYEFPDSLETYYQEAGRAGRDGERARAVLLFRLEDRRIQRFFLRGRYPRLEEVRRVLDAISPPALANSDQPRKPATAIEVAEIAQLPRRRSQVILHLLREGGIVRREMRGYRSQGRREVTDQELERMVGIYVEREHNDLERLEEMMRYAESAQCRKRLIRAYFGEAEGEPCGMCDNCLASQAESSHEEGEIAAPASKPEVVEIDTPAGSFQTTAPETLPSKAPPLYRAGDIVHHRRFGRGRVLDFEGENLLARFEKAGHKKVRVTYVRKVS